MSIDGTPSINNAGDQSMEIALATKMQLVLDQPMSDITTKLVNKDFEGDFFKIGDTVSIVKPDIDSITVKLGKLGGGTATDKDNRLTATEVGFEKTTMTIDSYAKYAFIISDITKAEGKWNYESGNLDLAAYKIRRAHNLEVCQLLLDEAVANRVELKQVTIANGDELYEKVLLDMHTELYDAGAITADGQVTYGSNPQEGKSTAGAIFMPKGAYNMFLTSKYFTDRSTQAADDKVATGNIAKVLGLEVNVEPALAPVAAADGKHVVKADTAGTQFVIIAGTRNAVTRAGKVLPPDSFRSHTRFGTEFHGLEIYGQKVATAQAVVVALVTVQA